MLVEVRRVPRVAEEAEQPLLLPRQELRRTKVLGFVQFPKLARYGKEAQ
jgi:hypothetical protein